MKKTEIRKIKHPLFPVANMNDIKILITKI